MQKYLVLSFDDGTIYDEQFVHILNKYSVPVTFNLNSGLNDFVWYCGERPIRRLNLPDHPGLYEGHEVAGHTLTHPCLTSLSEEQLREEINRDADNLSEIFGYRVTSFAVPFNACTEREIRVIRENTGIKAVRLSVLKEKNDFAIPEDPWHFEVNALYQDEDIFAQIRKFAENDLEKSVFIIAGHSYEFEMNGHWEYIEELIRYIAGFEEFETVTFKEAAERLFGDPASDVTDRTDQKIIASPLNYTGGKAKLLPQIRPLFPGKIDQFVDLFCGGCNVGVNTLASRHYYNDTAECLIELYKTFMGMSEDELIADLEKIIEDYDLSDSGKNGYAYYNCNSSDGLSPHNKSRFLRLREDFNSLTKKDRRYYEMFFVLIIFGFNNQIRFNSRGEYNLPVGKRDFNAKIREKLLNFVRILKSQDPVFSCGSFEEFDTSVLTKDSLVYCDPPYLITTASYNENGGWTEENERALLAFLDSLNKRGIRFALSNVLKHKGKENRILKEWAEKNGYYIHRLDFDYRNSSYHTKDKKTKSEEVLVTNYRV